MRISFCMALLLGACAVGDDTAELAPWRGDETTGVGTLAAVGMRCEAWTTVEPDGAHVSVRLVNEGDRDVEFLAWGTAWDHDLEVFDVRGPDGEVPFLGIRPFGRAVGIQDLVRVPAGDAIETSYALSRNHPVSSSQHVMVSHRSPSIVVWIDGREHTLQHGCGAGEVVLEPIEVDHGTVEQGLEIHEDCSADKRAKLEVAFEVVWTAENAARREAMRDSTMYRRYFGTWSQSNSNKVVSRFNSMLGYEWGEQVRCQSSTCSEHPTWAGYYDPNWDRIYVCHWGNDTFNARAISTAGILIHEMSHDVGTDDVVDTACSGGSVCYGWGNSQVLAQRPACEAGASSCKAIDSATNYEFFAQDSLLQIISAATY